jgi:hypothetical protein
MAQTLEALRLGGLEAGRLGEEQLAAKEADAKRAASMDQACRDFVRLPLIRPLSRPASPPGRELRRHDL